jgi:hypothetical protein
VLGRILIDGFLDAVRTFATGAHRPETIVLGAAEPEAVPTETVVLHGVSLRTATWSEYPDG